MPTAPTNRNNILIFQYDRGCARSSTLTPSRKCNNLHLRQEISSLKNQVRGAVNRTSSYGQSFNSGSALGGVVTGLRPNASPSEPVAESAGRRGCKTFYNHVKIGYIKSPAN